MEGSSWDNNGSGDPDFGIFCYCGEPTILRKSGTQKNPGRRFFGCANYKVERSSDCGFFCWYEPCISQGRADLGPMMVQKKKKAVRTVEQCESSASMSISEEMQRTTITMQMKIEAMQKEIDAMRKRMRNEGKMNWNYLWIIFFCVVSYMCGKSSQ
ncbi:uncharacterized protein LOC131324146 isoform X1 [Rhododendron vialii]|uniref:uncharacterized protein LOC131324146 isoform X1 n=1 Tax=Rhododendron vialii TaxID=182163 RepID=UPI002660238C|nr:uncharacterized protein LOC131324146 isoform X1 [Rhododendron vialii]